MPDASKFNKLAGKRVLILGGTSGIGFGVAEGAVEAGASVVVSSSSRERVDKTVAALRASYPSRVDAISGHTCDLGDDATLEANLVQLLKDATDGGARRLDHIVFTAADPLAIKPLTEVGLADMHAAGRVRFFAPMLLAKHTKDYVTPGRESSFTLTTGSVAERPHLNWVVVGAYAAGLPGMVRGLALDFAPLRFNAVSPGYVDTELWKMMPSEAKQKHFEEVASYLPTGAIAKPEDVAETYLYLMRDYNATGAVVTSNSGHMLIGK